jgi:Helix-turn-helix domain
LTKLKVTQKEFLETYLRGTGKTISSKQAEATYGIKSLRARISEMRKADLKVSKAKNSNGRAAYSVSARDVAGSRAAKFIK